MKFIKIMIAFIAITMMITTASANPIESFDMEGGTISQNPTGSQQSIIGEWESNFDIGSNPTGYFHNGDFPKGAISQNPPDDDFGYLHSGAKSNTGKDNPDPQKHF